MMSKQSPASELDYERILLSQGKRKVRVRLNPSRCGDLILLALLAVASFFSFISLITQSVSFEITRNITSDTLACTLFNEYNGQSLDSPSDIPCYSAIGATIFILVGILTHFTFISIKCCANREWGCLESLHPILGVLILIASLGISIHLVLGFQHTCNSLRSAGMSCELVSGVPFRDLVRQGPVSLWVTTILILFVEIIFVVRTTVYFYKCMQTGRFNKNEKSCLDCLRAGRSLRKMFSH